MKYKKVKFEKLLVSVTKPTRYINNELNSLHKNLSEASVNFCLAFPDVYEVGFSHLGLKILYSILNNEKDAVADRVYMPWEDFADQLKDNKLPLFGLESHVAVKDFDVLGITLQSELTYTNILHLLELSEIPILREERTETDPIVLTGGPCSTNPMPLSDFIDAFLIGDAEEAIIEIKDAVKSGKTRKERLDLLSKIEGVFVPQFGTQKKIEARKYMDFSTNSNKHTNQLIPWMLPTHFRYVTEVMRGCTAGCRFCHAGYFYRPAREIDPKILLENLKAEVSKYGWDESALTSLSTGDYSCIKEVMYELYKFTSETKTDLSLPSLRVDSIDDDLTKLLNKMHQTGLTIAPEAGSQRLRNIINKNISEEDIIKAVQTALNNGWKLLKLYFMIGLPFEEESDITEIIKLVEKIIEISNKKIRINITISPFVPKVFTPFQWQKQDNRESLLKNSVRIKSSLARYKFIKVSYHDPKTSALECVLGRGDEKVGNLIYQAYLNGAKFDGWNEFFDYNKWEQAAKTANINFEDYTSEIPLNAELPWQHIDIGVSDKFMKEELEKAKIEASTPDCKIGKCSLCGLCNSTIKNITFDPKEIDIKFTELAKTNPQNVFHFRIFFSKTGLMQYVAHLDMVRMLQRIMRISKLPIAYSLGFNVHPRVSPGPPLSIGIQGENEYCDFVLESKVRTDEILTALRKSFPNQLTLKKIQFLENKKQRAMEFFQYEEMQIIPPENLYKTFSELSENFNNCESKMYTRIRKGKERTADLKKLVKQISWKDGELNIIKSIVGAGIFDILREVYGIQREDTNEFVIIRKRLIEKE